MRAVVQRVARAEVRVNGERTAGIGTGLLVLLGVATDDSQEDARYIAEKVVNLRIFEDDEGKMNHSVLDKSGAVLVISQFTLLGDARKGRRPSYTDAAGPELAEPLYQQVCTGVRGHGVPVAQGVFGAEMEIELVNQGPVTILLDSRRLF